MLRKPKSHGSRVGDFAKTANRECLRRDDGSLRAGDGESIETETG